MSRHWRRDAPAARGEDHSEAGYPPAAHGGPRWSRYQPTTPLHTQSLREASVLLVLLFLTPGAVEKFREGWITGRFRMNP